MGARLDANAGLRKVVKPALFDTRRLSDDGGEVGCRLGVLTHDILLYVFTVELLVWCPLCVLNARAFVSFRILTTERLLDGVHVAELGYCAHDTL